MQINKYLEATLWKEFVQGVADSAYYITFYTDIPIPEYDFEHLDLPVTPWITTYDLPNRCLLRINLTPTERINFSSDKIDLQTSWYWNSTANWKGLKDGVANYFLISTSWTETPGAQSTAYRPLFMGTVSDPLGTGDMKLSDNNIVTGDRYKIYGYTLKYIAES